MLRLASGSLPLAIPIDLLPATWVHDAGPGLANIYLHARYYDPVLGVFLSPDPASADMNSYRYAGGDPVNMRDPSGLMEESLPEGCEAYWVTSVKWTTSTSSGIDIVGYHCVRYAWNLHGSGPEGGPGGVYVCDPTDPLESCYVPPGPDDPGPTTPEQPGSGCLRGVAGDGCGPVVKTPKGCETAILGIPCLPKNASPELTRKFNESYTTSLDLLRTPGCNALFNGRGADGFAATRYVIFNDPKDPSVATHQPGGNVVRINEARFDVNRPPGMIPTTTSWFGGTGFGALYLLHENGHLLNVIPYDGGNPRQSYENSAAVNNACFR
jgi:RHS repeat-associated protein